MGFALVLFSCNSGNKESSTSTSVENTGGAVNNTSDGNSYDCLKPFQEDYSKLLTKEDMASVYPIPFDEAKVDLSSGSYGSHIYSWPSDRPEMEQEVSGMKFKTPDKNTMGVALLSFFSDSGSLQADRELFDRAYKQLTDEELKQIEDNLAKQDEETKKTATQMMKVRNKSSWKFVEGTGNSAWYKWNDKYGGELAVLAGKAKFYIRLKVSLDPEENLQIARKLAQKILDKCN